MIAGLNSSSTGSVAGFRFWPSHHATGVEKTYTSSHSKLDRDFVQTLSGQVMQGYTLVRPLTVIVEQDEQGMFLAGDQVSTVYGYGETGPEAVADYVVSLIEYYELLEESDSLAAVRALDALRGYLFKNL